METKEFDFKELIGKTEQEAEGIAVTNGYTTRVMYRDGESLIGDCAYRVSRINLHIENGIVTDTYLG